MTNYVYFPVTPSNTVPVGPGLVNAIFIPGGTANTATVSVQSSYDSEAVTLTGPAAGQWMVLPWPVLLILATGTTVTGMVAAIKPFGVSPSQPL